MAYNYDYPYVDAGRQNADWMLKEIETLDKKVNLTFDDELRSFILEHFNSLFAGLAYVPETHTLKLYLGLVGDGEHLYTPSDETMTII